MVELAVTVASGPTLMKWPKLAVLAERQTGATLAAVRAPVVLAAVAARRVAVPTAEVDNQAEAKAERTVRQTVGRAVAEMAAPVVTVAMAARSWCRCSTTRRCLSARPAEQVSRALQGVVGLAVAAGLARRSWPVAAAVVRAQAGPLVAEPAVAVAVADRSASMLLALTAS